MSSTDVEPITDRLHTGSWSANLEQPEHAADRELVVEQAIEAVRHTAEGTHVNLVTHGEQGHPDGYLYGALREAVEGIDVTYVDRCGCGGHVTRVFVRDRQ